MANQVISLADRVCADIEDWTERTGSSEKTPTSISKKITHHP